MKKALLLVTLLLVAGSAFAQGISASSSTTTLKLVKAETLSISSGAPSVDMTISGVGNGDSNETTVTLTPTWTLASTRTSVDLCVLSGNLTSVTTGVDTVTPTNIYAGGSTANTAMGSGTVNCGVAGAVSVKTISLATNADRKNNDSHFGGFPAVVAVKNLPNLAPATYTGTLTVYAYVAP